MTLDDVEARLAEIRHYAKGDDEAAHSREDALWAAVLEALAPTNPIAAAALKSREIYFARWCA